ncbi:MAG: SpoIID/LytB domain-containing protein [candidate division Zixibacteria bacterium]|nr:SpoIID/LytB domain-containing protein [candidate division Zixibacteria bacterium]
MKSRIVSLIFLITAFCHANSVLADVPLVRIKIAQSQSEFFVLPEGQVQVSCYQGREVVVRFSSQRGLTARLNSETMILDEGGTVKSVDLDRIFVRPEGNQKFASINGKKFRGYLEIAVDRKSNEMLGINHVNLENYLKGVVPLEMGVRLMQTPADQEAFKVQAVAARTYALTRLGSNGARLYDLESTVRDQVYGGYEVEEEVINWAIDQTKGEVLTDGQMLVQAYFHANCGGATEDIQNTWPWRDGEPYLISHEDSDYCSWAKNYAWEQEWSKAELEESINAFFRVRTGDSTFQSGNLLDLQILRRSNAGRVEQIRILTDRGEWGVQADSIRWCFRKQKLGRGIMPSIKFELEITRNQADEIFAVKFTGRGNGHGVGMCQIGSLGRARAGQTYRQILSAYYNGSELKKMY